MASEIDLMNLRIELFTERRNVCDLVLEIYKRDLAMLTAQEEAAKAEAERRIDVLAEADRADPAPDA